MSLGLGLSRAKNVYPLSSGTDECEEEECDEGFTWNQDECECLCDEEECELGYTWSTAECECLCDAEECSDGYTWSYSECRCERD